MPKRVLVGYGIDVDAAAGWINTKDGSAPDPVNISRGIFGAAVGIDRLLKLFDEYKIKASWFVPAHTAESFPKPINAIHKAGHEIGLHGYSHEFVSKLDEKQERDVLANSIAILTSLTGHKPLGWTAPAWTTSPRTVHLLEEHGIIYDHSFMHHDCKLYYTPYSSYDAVATTYDSSDPNFKSQSADTWMTPVSIPSKSSLVTVPANWHLDDWPPFQPRVGGSDGFIDTASVERLWKDHFEYCYEHYDEFVMPISIHPQVSGKPQVLQMHRRFIEWVNAFDGVEWCTFGTMVERFKEDGFAGFDVAAALV